MPTGKLSKNCSPKKENEEAKSCFLWLEPGHKKGANARYYASQTQGVTYRVAGAAKPV
jgi:hypothetical protein